MITRPMTHEEHAYLYNTFQTFAPFHLLPTWAKKILEIDYADILTILSKSIQKMQTDNQDLQDWMTLAQLEYNGSIPAETFEITITTILERLKESDIKANDKLGCQLILKGLSGEYSCLRQQFRSRRNMKMSDLFIEIQSIYDEQKVIRYRKFNKMKISDDYYRTNRVPPPMTDAKIAARTSKKSAPSRHSPRTGKRHNVATSNNFPRANDPSMDVPSTRSIQLNNNAGITLRPTKY